MNVNSKKEEEKKEEEKKEEGKRMMDGMTKKERDSILKMSKSEIIKKKHEIAKAITESRIMKCNLERLAYLYDETNKKIDKIKENEKNNNQEYHQCSISDFIRIFISLLFAIALIAVEFTWVYNSPKESKYVVKINFNDTFDESNEEDEKDSTLRFLNEYLNNNSYNNNYILFRYLDDLNDNNDNNNNNLDDNNNDLNKTLNKTDDSIVPFDSNVLFVGLVLVSVYFYFTFFGIVCRNFIYEGTLIGTKNTDTLSLLNFAV